MKKIITLWLCLLPFLVAVDCGGEEPTDPSQPDTPEERLVQNWNITAVVIDGQSQTPSSQSNVGFNSDNSYNITLPELEFFPASGTWEFTGGDTKISINDGQFVFDVIELDEDSMILELNYENFKSEPTVYQLTFLVVG
ncbi:lipocalin family protein [Tunicatimonas pelagia]|uniref:lipocalin family protein n=1 Tax=Tunicatimonas pelagia TaxID=931531 RepID=UPI002665A0AD|nr:DUF5004 domain-containing protein [Tunicatimonas pelagia]WKN45267.1 DUF5004 domain-containing protein [Tunicatimonas pelagia]